ncbi:hypothetical protein Caci_6920 [Catenulispora acidiphila DSM 44928]|uniref:AB hydrolase-1 domain-containing protein n=1 Tax=Catenulispora acidiphila (strain DSM 44928 / JCM 14897 / NBRC 102108 / NRRL B-24433 / ID139908) TaxID=479433 RepID=C7Q3I9_CATAD|nr:alpha/beta hydrolase [Catenulispora acidiphila]ACU75754.1 hypothetical protein Caci_6920 [Catenulispora acidiphila DSM 44928]
MARIIGICGVGNDPRTHAFRSVEKEWIGALLRGMRCTGTTEDPVLDFECLCFADLLDPADPFGGGVQQDFICRFGGRRVNRTRDFLTHVSAYLADQRVREKVQQRIADRVGPDTRVLIGHSLGSVAAYETLCRASAQGVQTLISLGSPLGFHRSVLRTRTAPNAAGRYPWPVGLRRWVNVYDWKDPFAAKVRLRPLFGDGRQVEDCRVWNWAWPHAATAYLMARPTAQAVTDALLSASDFLLCKSVQADAVGVRQP